MAVIADVKNIMVGGARFWVRNGDAYDEVGLLRGNSQVQIQEETIPVYQGVPRKLVANKKRQVSATVNIECMDISLPVIALALGQEIVTEGHDVIDGVFDNVTIARVEDQPPTATLTNVPPVPDDVAIDVEVDGHHVNVIVNKNENTWTLTEMAGEENSWGDAEELTKVILKHSVSDGEMVVIGADTDVLTMGDVILTKYNKNQNKTMVINIPFIQSQGGLDLSFDNDAQDVMAVGVSLSAVANPSNLNEPLCDVRFVDGEFIPVANPTP